MKAQIISAVVKDGQVRQIMLNTELTSSIGIHIVGIREVTDHPLKINMSCVVHQESGHTVGMVTMTMGDIPGSHTDLLRFGCSGDLI